MIHRASVLLALCMVLGNVTSSLADRPNVLMICIDDLNDWVGCLGGHPNANTPQIDSLARRGRLFTNAHCVVPVCSPSRVSIMSGVHATTHGSYELGPDYRTIPKLKDVPTMQAYFKQHGYRTFAGGKVLHHGFTGHLADGIDVNLGDRRGGPRPKEVMNWTKGAWDWGGFPETDEQMFDFQLAKSAAAALQLKHDQPFFISVGFFRPHVPMFVPPKWFEMFAEDQITLPNVPDDDMDDVPPNFQEMPMIAPTFREIRKAGKWRSLVQAYLANTSFVDRCVGSVIDSLDGSPYRDNTLVVLWSDHGFHLGEKHQIAKRMLWEESTRVPLIVAGPGISPGSSCAEAVSLLDIYPTLVDLCQLPENPHLEGESLRMQLDHATAPRHRPVLTSSYYGNHAVRSRDWRYIRYKDGAEELYDHRNDPNEFHNLANDPKFADQKAGLAKWIPAVVADEVWKKNSK
ncbi:MAG: sulfatase [Planctomycetales bacterium]|nr:sulfatase [Planctomycetales bacterium]